MTPLDDRQLQDVAVLVASLDTETAETLLSRLSSRQAERVRHAVEGLPEVSTGLKQSLAADFMEVVRGAVESNVSPTSNVDAGPLEYVQLQQASDVAATATLVGAELNVGQPLESELVVASVGETTTASHAHEVESDEQVANCESPDSATSRPLDVETPPRTSLESNRISSATCIDQIARLLKNEHPQTIAAVVSTLAPARAAVLIQSLTADQQYDVVRRLAEMQPIDVESLHEVEKELREQLQRGQELASRSRDGWQTVRSILGSADSKSRSEIMDNLGQFDRSLVSRLQSDTGSAERRAGFGGSSSEDSEPVFESLIELESSVLVTLFDSVPHKLTATAFAAASPQDLSNLMSRLPAQLAEHLRVELTAIGPLCLSEIHDAQALLAKAAKGLLRDRAGQSPGSGRLRLSA